MQICQTTLLVNVHSSKPPPSCCPKTVGKVFRLTFEGLKYKSLSKGRFLKRNSTGPTNQKHNSSGGYMADVQRSYKCKKDKSLGLKVLSLRKICQRKIAEPDGFAYLLL